jgi:hypothetical protein
MMAQSTTNPTTIRFCCPCGELLVRLATRCGAGLRFTRVVPSRQATGVGHDGVEPLNGHDVFDPWTRWEELWVRCRCSPPPQPPLHFTCAELRELIDGMRPGPPWSITAARGQRPDKALTREGPRWIPLRSWAT